jgi:hypothetical protein
MIPTSPLSRDLLWGLTLALAVVALLLLGTSGPKFIYVDF